MNDDVEVLDISCFRQTKRVRLTLEDGTVKNCVLREMTTPDKEAWMQTMDARMQTDKDGKVRVKSFQNLQATLISKCLFDEDGKQVSIEFIQKNVPSLAQDRLHAECERLNALTRAAQEEAKKD